MFTILYVWRDSFQELFKLQNFSSYTSIVLLVIIVRTLNSNSVSILNALIKHVYKNTIQLVGYIIQVLLFIYVIETGFGIYGLIVAYLVSSIFNMLMYGIILFKNYITIKDGPNIIYPKKEIARYGFFGMLREYGDIVFSNISDIFIIGIYLEPVSVAIYALAIKIVNMASSILPVNMGKNAIMPVFFKKYELNKEVRYLENGFSLFNKIISFIVFPMIAYFIVFSEKIISNLYGAHYSEASIILKILITLGAINTFALSFGLVLLALKRIEISFYSRIFIFYNIGMAIFLVNKIGLIGVAIATGSTIIFKNAFIFVMLRKHLKLYYKLESFLKPAINSVIFYVIILLLDQIITQSIGIILLLIFSPGIYIILSFYNKTFNEKERNIIRDNLSLPSSFFNF